MREGLGDVREGEQGISSCHECSCCCVVVLLLLFSYTEFFFNIYFFLVLQDDCNVVDALRLHFPLGWLVRIFALFSLFIPRKIKAKWEKNDPNTSEVK